MRLRVLCMDGMVRPLVVVDDAGSMDLDQGATVAEGLRRAMPDCNVVLIDVAVDLPQLGDVR